MAELEQKWNIYDYLRTIPAFIFAGIIFYFSSLSAPYPTRPPEPPQILNLEININDILHLCEFALLSFLVAFGFYPKIKLRFLIPLTIIYAILDEIHQYFVPSRYFDIYDIFLDSIGVIIGIFAYLILYMLINKIIKTESPYSKEINEF